MYRGVVMVNGQVPDIPQSDREDLPLCRYNLSAPTWIGSGVSVTCALLKGVCCGLRKEF